LPILARWQMSLGICDLARCAANGMWVTLGVVRAVPGDSVGVAFIVCGRAGAVCKRAGVRPVLPVGRGPFTAGVPGRLGRHMVRRPVPCPNSPRAAAAARKFMPGKIPAVSTVRISDGRGREGRTP